jgi:nucleoside-diphosphate-sugar epimerase
LGKLVLQKGYIPIVGKGQARWNNVHVQDLAKVYCALVDRAVAGDTNPELFGAKGYMFAENGEHKWSELATTMATEAHRLGYIDEPKEYQLGKDEALEVAGFEAVSWGLNSRGKADRARKFLNWQPTHPSIEEEVPNILKAEKELLDAK